MTIERLNRRQPRIILPGLPALLLWSMVSAQPGAHRPAADFYAMLQEMPPAYPEEGYRKVQEFLAANPHFDQAYLRLLEWYLYDGQLPLAKTYFQQLAAMPAYAANSNWCLALIHRMENRADSAWMAYLRAVQQRAPPLTLLKEAVEFAVKEKAPEGFAAIQKRLPANGWLLQIAAAFQHYYQREYAKTIDIFQALPAALRRDPVILDTWGYCCHSLASRTTSGKADSLWALGETLAREMHEKSLEARFLSNRGYYAYKTLENDTLALRFYDQALAIAIQTRDYHRQMMIAGYRGYLFRKRADYLEAERHYLEAIRIASRLNNPRFLAEWFRGYGMNFYFLSNFEASLEALDQSAAFASRADRNEAEVDASLDRAEVYLMLKEFKLAQATLDSAMRLSNAYHLPGRYEFARVKTGLILLAQKQYAQAEQVFRRYLAYLGEKPGHTREAAYWRGKIGEIYRLNGNASRARQEFLRAYHTAREANDALSQGWYLLRIADVDKLSGRPDSALAYYRQAETIALNFNQGSEELRWEIYHGLGDIHQQSAQWDSAIQAYEQSAANIEKLLKKLDVDLMRIGYFTEKFPVYRKLGYAYYQRYLQNGDRSDLDNIYRSHTRSQGRALAQLQGDQAQSYYTVKYRQAVQRLRILQRKIRDRLEDFQPETALTALYQELDIARLSLQAQRLQLARITEVDSTGEIAPPPSLEAVQRNIGDDDTAILLYHLAREGSFVMILRRNGIHLCELKDLDLETLGREVDTLMSPFHNAQTATVLSAPFHASIAHRLYRKLVLPLEAQKLLPRKLVIVPDMAIVNLPFEMLLKAPPKQDQYTPRQAPEYAGDFLLHDYVISYSPNLYRWEHRPEAYDYPAEMLIFSNPVQQDSSEAPPADMAAVNLRGWTLAPLIYSHDEARSILAIEPRARLFSGKNATRNRLLAEPHDYRILHFSTHGFVDKDFDAFSGLVLASSEDLSDDGLLMGYEIETLRLKCDLVTLSACETGRGRRVAGEGALGLPRMFMGAGARSVLMTLWKVDDKFSSILMPEFYRHLLRQGYGKAEALQRAKQRTIERVEEHTFYYQHPFFWAAFTLYGDPGSGAGGWGVFWRRNWALLLAALVLLVLAVVILRRRRLRG